MYGPMSVERRAVSIGALFFTVFAIILSLVLIQPGASASASIPVNGIDTTITSGPTGTTADATPTFGFESNIPIPQIVGFRCSVDGGSWTTCASPTTTASLDDGPHEFRARTVLLGLFMDPTPASSSFTVDTTAPTVDITSPVADEDGDHDVTLGFAPAAIGGSGASSCAVDGAGAVKCWGWNNNGQLGNGSTVNSSQPVTVSGLAGPVAEIDGDQAHTCARLVSGAVQCWGWNTFGQLGDGTTTSRTAPTDVVDMDADVVDISGGGSFNCGLLASGGVKCWGRQASGQLGNGVSSLSSSTATDVIGLTSGVESIDSGDGHSCALLTTGEVKCWGSNNYGQLGDGTETNRSTPVTVVGLGGPVEAVVTGTWRTCVLLTSGGVECWGWNPWGQLGDGTTSDHRSTPGPVTGITDAVELSAGFQLTCARRATGQLTCWGGGGYGERGDGASSTALTPTDVTGMSSTAEFFARGNHACALSTAGELKCWGYNIYGQVGDGTTTNRNVPTAVLGLSAGPSIPDVVFTSSEPGSTLTCAIDGAAPVACASPFSPGSLSVGMHTVTVTATDSVGNSGSDSIAIEVHAPPPDPTPPETSMTGPTGFTNDATPTYSLSADKPAATFECSVDSGAYAAAGSTFTTSTLSSTSSHTIRCRATAAGLTDPTPATATVTIDTLAPVVSATCTVTAASEAHCTFTATDPSTTIPGSGGGTCITLYPSPCCPPGMVCIATPSCTPYPPMPGYYSCYYPAPPIVIPGSGIDRVECAVDGDTAVACTSPFVSSVLGPGNHTVTITAYDRAGNASTAVRSVTI